ncbi:MAG: hypothetical protein RMX97_17815 [Nostoc sp. DedQUE11]|nr:hypothetical protein [Nostoc sp. DedQUE11]
MGRRFGNVIYIDRNPNNPGEGWGWVEVTTEDMKRFAIPNKHPTMRKITATLNCKSTVKMPVVNLPFGRSHNSQGTTFTKPNWRK